MMSSVRAIAVIILASVTLSISLAAKISLGSKNNMAVVSHPLTLICTWEEDEVAEGDKVMWRWPKNDGTYYSFYSYKYSPSTPCQLEDKTTAIKHHFIYSDISVKCISRTSLSLTIDPVITHYNDVHIFCTSRSSRFKPAWYTIKVPQLLPNAIIRAMPSTTLIKTGSNLRLTCSWVSYAMGGKTVYWNWPHGDNVYDTPCGYYQSRNRISRGCPRMIPVRPYPDNHFAGRTRVECLLTTKWVLHISNISHLDDGIPINCWGYQFDASYTIHVYAPRRPKHFQLVSNTFDTICLTWDHPDDKSDIQKYRISLIGSHYKQKYHLIINSSLTNYCLEDLIPSTVYNIGLAAQYMKGEQVLTPKLKVMTSEIICAYSPCRNGGTCVDEEGTFKCSCPALFKGLRCSKLKPMSVLGISILLLLLTSILTHIAIRCKHRIQEADII